jgi:hypothetical protein
MSIVTQIAKAVVTELNKNIAYFSIPFEAEMRVLPSFEPAELQTLRISVVPRTLEMERISRSSSKYSVGIDIGIQRRIEGTPEETVAKIGHLVDEIMQFLKERTLSNFPAAQWNGITNDPVYVPEHLQQKRTFTSILNVRYLLLD